METKVFKINPDNIDGTAIVQLRECADIIKRGGLVCMPTETVYGLGANAYDPVAVSNIFKAKGRPSDNPLIVHICNYDMLELIVKDSFLQEGKMTALGDRFWPGPLTMIAPKTSIIPAVVSGGLDTVGVRYPCHPIASALIKLAGVPIAAPSANLSGKPSPTCFEHVKDDMMGRVDAIIDGGDCRVGVESTVLDITGSVPNILRPGAVTLADVKSVIEGSVEADWHLAHGIDTSKVPKSPGLKYKHYAPDAPLYIFTATDCQIMVQGICEKIIEEKNKKLSVGVLATDENRDYYKGADMVQSVGSGTNSMEHAAALFTCLRRFDEAGVDVIIAEMLPQTGVGDAVMNRLYRAAAGRVIKLD